MFPISIGEISDSFSSVFMIKLDWIFIKLWNSDNGVFPLQSEIVVLNY